MNRNFGDDLMWWELLGRENLSLVAGRIFVNARLKRKRKIVGLIVLRTWYWRVDGSRVGKGKSFVVAIADRRLMLGVIVMRSHRWISVVRRVGVTIWMAIVRGDAIWRLNCVWHDRVFVGVEQTLIETVTNVGMFLHWVIVVVEPRHLHHSNAVVILRVDIQMFAKPVAVIVDSVAIHRESNDEKQKKNNANDGENRRVSGRKEIVVHDWIDHDVVVTVAIRSKNSVETSRFGGTKRNRQRRFIVVCVAPETSWRK